MLNSEFNGLGRRPRSTRPMCSHPPQDALAPGIDQAQEQYENEDSHFNQAETRVALELSGPREDEDRLYVKDDEEKGKDVVANLALRPTFTNRVNTALVCQLLFSSWLDWAEEGRDPEQKARDQDGRKAKPDHGEKRPQERRHRRKNYYFRAWPPEIASWSSAIGPPCELVTR